MFGVAMAAARGAAGAGSEAYPILGNVEGVDYAFTTTTGSVDTKAVSLTIKAGRLSLGWMGDEGNRTLNLPSGYADAHGGQVDHDGNASFDFRIVWDILAAQITSQTFTISSATAGWDCGLINISNAHATTPIDVYAVDTSQTDDTAVCPTVTTTVPNCLILRMLAIDNNPGSGVAYPSGIMDTGKIFLQRTLVTGTTQMYISLATEKKETAGATGATATWGTSWATNRRSIAFTIAIAPP